MDTTKSRAETSTLQVGDIAPNFTLKTNSNEDWRLSNFRGKKNVVLALRGQRKRPVEVIDCTFSLSSPGEDDCFPTKLLH